MVCQTHHTWMYMPQRQTATRKHPSRKWSGSAGISSTRRFPREKTSTLITKLNNNLDLGIVLGEYPAPAMANLFYDMSPHTHFYELSSSKGSCNFQLKNRIMPWMNCRLLEVAQLVQAVSNRGFPWHNQVCRHKSRSQLHGKQLLDYRQSIMAMVLCIITLRCYKCITISKNHTQIAPCLQSQKHADIGCRSDPDWVIQLSPGASRDWV